MNIVLVYYIGIVITFVFVAIIKRNHSKEEGGETDMTNAFLYAMIWPALVVCGFLYCIALVVTMLCMAIFEKIKKNRK